MTNDKFAIGHFTFVIFYLVGNRRFVQTAPAPAACLLPPAACLLVVPRDSFGLTWPYHNFPFTFCL